MAKPIIYTVTSCPASIQLKKDWSKQGIEFEERQVDQSQVFLDQALKYADMVPIIVYGDGRVEIGYKNMMG
jgi:glutaredoxin-related protein